MSSNEREMLLMAYMDGQMSSTEAAAFDASLSDEERDLITAELRFEAGLTERIQNGTTCPEASWKRTQILIRNQSTGHARRWALPGATLAAAAVLMLVVFTTIKWQGASLQAMLEAPTDSLKAFAATSEVEDTPEAINQFLAEHGISAEFKSAYEPGTPEAHHYTALLGARERHYDGEAVVEVLYNCCGSPAKVVMTQQNTSAAKALLTSKDANIRSVRETPGFVAGVVSYHAADDLVKLLHPTTI